MPANDWASVAADLVPGFHYPETFPWETISILEMVSLTTIWKIHKASKNFNGLHECTWESFLWATISYFGIGFPQKKLVSRPDSITSTSSTRPIWLTRTKRPSRSSTKSTRPGWWGYFTERDSAHWPDRPNCSDRPIPIRPAWSDPIDWSTWRTRRNRPNQPAPSKPTGPTEANDPFLPYRLNRSTQAKNCATQLKPNYLKRQTRQTRQTRLVSKFDRLNQPLKSNIHNLNQFEAFWLRLHLNVCCHIWNLDANIPNHCHDQRNRPADRIRPVLTDLNGVTWKRRLSVWVGNLKSIRRIDLDSLSWTP